MTIPIAILRLTLRLTLGLWLGLGLRLIVIAQVRDLLGFSWRPFIRQAGVWAGRQA